LAAMNVPQLASKRELANQAYGPGPDQILTTRRDGLEPDRTIRCSAD